MFDHGDFPEGVSGTGEVTEVLQVSNFKRSWARLQKCGLSNVKVAMQSVYIITNLLYTLTTHKSINMTVTSI